MKIGLSYSRCVRDIVEGIVDIDDVLIVIARTDFNPHEDEQWASIWQGYHWGNPEWADYPDEDEHKFRDVSMQLWDEGKFHQPRKFGAHPIRRREFWLETCLPDSELERNPAAKECWDKFQMVAGLTSIGLDKTYS